MPEQPGQDGMAWLFELRDDAEMEEELRATREALKRERATVCISGSPLFVLLNSLVVFLRAPEICNEKYAHSPDPLAKRRLLRPSLHTPSGFPTRCACSPQSANGNTRRVDSHSRHKQFIANAWSCVLWICSVGRGCGGGRAGAYGDICTGARVPACAARHCRCMGRWYAPTYELRTA